MPVPRSRLRRPACAVLALLFLQAGCANVSVAPPGTTHHGTTGAVAVLAAADSPAVRFEGFSQGRGAAALASADATFGTCVSALGGGHCSGSACGAVVLFWLAFCGVASAVGGVVGAVSAPGNTAVFAAESAFGASEQGRVLQESLRLQVESTAHDGGTTVVPMPEAFRRHAAQTGDLALLAAAGADSVLETALVRAGTQGAGSNDAIQGYLDARVRLLRAADGQELFAADYRYLSPRRTLGAWALRDGRAFRDAFAEGYAALGAHIHDHVFLLYPLPDQAVHPAGTLASAFGLAPLSPPLRGALTGTPLIGRYFPWPLAESLRPTLRWQAFPRAGDLRVAPESMARVRRVRYDLVIAREDDGAPGAVIYRRQGLPHHSHALEHGLASGQRYFWTVRARFELDGREWVSEWGATGTDAAGSRHHVAPSHYAYRFRTP